MNQLLSQQVGATTGHVILRRQQHDPFRPRTGRHRPQAESAADLRRLAGHASRSAAASIAEPLGIRAMQAESGDEAAESSIIEPVHIAVVDLEIPIAARAWGTTRPRSGVLQLLKRLETPPPTIVVKPRHGSEREHARSLSQSLRRAHSPCWIVRWSWNHFSRCSSGCCRDTAVKLRRPGPLVQERNP